MKMSTYTRTHQRGSVDVDTQSPRLKERHTASLAFLLHLSQPQPEFMEDPTSQTNTILPLKREAPALLQSDVESKPVFTTSRL